MEKMMVNSEDIYQKLAQIFMERFHIDIGQQDGPVCDKKLLGNEVGLNARDLVYLYFDIERVFQIEIPDEEIAEGHFNTAGQILMLIERQFSR